MRESEWEGREGREGGREGGVIKMYHLMQLENIRRKHNYLPLIMEVLKILAKKGELVKLVEQVSSD